MSDELFVEKDFGKKTFLRLAGGKQHLLDRLTKTLPDDSNKRRYIEPFFGGGSLFFATAPTEARIGDANHLMIEMYQYLVDDPSAVHSHLLSLAEMHDERFYYEVRSSFNRKSASHKKAAQLIYLNRSCFNGVFRVNQQSEFNVPWGKKQQILIPTQDYLKRAAELLGRSEMSHGDFSGLLEDVGEGDMVYLDPPYVPIDRTAHFRHYTSPRFSLDDHERLANWARKIADNGAHVMVSNSDLPVVRSMFCGWHFTSLSISRHVTSKKTDVRRFQELIITSYPVPSLNGGRP